MSIALATKGRLWPAGGGIVIREQFVDIVSTITDPWEVTIEMSEVAEIVAEVTEDPAIIATVEVEDTVTDEVEVDVDVTGTVEDC